MFVLLYIPQGADPEVFGVFPTPNAALNILRKISTAAGQHLDASYSDVLATIDVTMDGERHRYQLVKVGSPDQLEAHAYVIEAERESAEISVEHRPDVPPPSRLSGY
ncbi:hypothetical protein BH23ACT4_BH23ACT4_12460 [soil metagenome]